MSIKDLLTIVMLSVLHNSPGNSFGLEPITERISPVSNGFPPSSTMNPLFAATSGTTGVDSIPRFSTGSHMIPHQHQQPTTMMQRLMADRRKRQKEYEQKRLSK